MVERRCAPQVEHGYQCHTRLWFMTLCGEFFVLGEQDLVKKVDIHLIVYPGLFAL